MWGGVVRGGGRRAWCWFCVGEGEENLLARCARTCVGVATCAEALQAAATFSPAVVVCAEFYVRARGSLCCVNSSGKLFDMSFCGWEVSCVFHAQWATWWLPFKLQASYPALQLMRGQESTGCAAPIMSCTPHNPFFGSEAVQESTQQCCLLSWFSLCFSDVLAHCACAVVSAVCGVQASSCCLCGTPCASCCARGRYQWRMCPTSQACFCASCTQQPLAPHGECRAPEAYSVTTLRVDTPANVVGLYVGLLVNMRMA